MGVVRTAGEAERSFFAGVFGEAAMADSAATAALRLLRRTGSPLLTPDAASIAMRLISSSSDSPGCTGCTGWTGWPSELAATPEQA